MAGKIRKLQLRLGNAGGKARLTTRKIPEQPARAYISPELKPNHSFHSKPQIEIDILCVNLGII